MNVLFRFYGLCFICFSLTVRSRKITTALNYGCQLIKLVNESKSLAKSWYQTKYPHLACSGANQSTLILNLSNVEETKSISLSYPMLDRLEIDQLVNTPNVTMLEVNANRLHDIEPSKSNLVLEKLVYLKIIQSHLLTIPDDALKSFPNLKYLIIYSTYLKGIYNTDFRFNLNLDLLYVKANDVLSFDEHWITNVNLTNLRLWRCSVEKIPNKLCAMPKLTSADMSYNNIIKLEPNTFDGCDRLEEIKLASNKISNVDRHSFQGANNLVRLDLSNNKIRSLSEGVFNSFVLAGLDINLYQNPIQCDCSMKWFQAWKAAILRNGVSTGVYYRCTNDLLNTTTTNSSLKDIRCDYNRSETNSSTSQICPQSCECYDSFGNQYRSNSSQVIKNQSHQKHQWMAEWKFERKNSVECRNTNLQKFPAQNISSNTEYIFMFGNNFTTLNLSDLKKFPHLKHFVLPGNNIKIVIPDSRLEIHSLTHLDLHLNQMTTIANEILKGFPNLKAINFHHNKIAKISSNIFLFNRKMERVRIGPNPVTSFQEDFLTTPHLTTILLHNLSLVNIPGSISQMKNLHRLELDDNFITTIKNGTFARCFFLKFLTIRNNRLTTIEANAFRGIASLYVLDLSFNNLSFVSPATLNNVTTEAHEVVLLENPFTCNCKMKETKTWIDWKQCACSNFQTERMIVKWNEMKRTYLAHRTQDERRVWETPKELRSTTSSHWRVLNSQSLGDYTYLDLVVGLNLCVRKLELNNDIRSIRFRCREPPKLRNKISSHLKDKDFACPKHFNGTINPSTSETHHLSSGIIAVAVIIGIFCCCFCVFAAVVLKRHYIRYGSRQRRGFRRTMQSDSTAILKDIEMT